MNKELKELMKDQLLDVTVIIGFDDFTEQKKPFTCSRILRLSVDGAWIEELEESIVTGAGVMHSEVVQPPSKKAQLG